MSEFTQPKISEPVDVRLIETFTSPTNIAVIKYWGKDNVKLNTPMNSSVSVTLDQSDLHTITTVAASQSFEKDRLWLNGIEIEINSRGLTCLREIRKLAQDRIDPTSNTVVVSKENWPSYHVHISSYNTFPTGAGLASSAAGLACFVVALAQLYNVTEAFPHQLSTIARQGSGSASRSLYGGFVRWEKGSKGDGSDSIAVQVADEEYWKELSAVILVVSDKEKDTSSTYGMETSRLTSPLLQFRAAEVVEPRLKAIEEAYLKRDFEAFGKITMQDSNQFHATCLDTYPPIFYLNDTSRIIIRIVHVINEFYGKVVAAYTFDAGPNAVIYCLEDMVPTLMAVAATYFPAPGTAEDYTNNPSLYRDVSGASTSGADVLPMALVDRINTTGRVPRAGDVKYIFTTKPGPGPLRQPLEESLIDPSSGLPRAPGPKHQKLQIK